MPPVYDGPKYDAPHPAPHLLYNPTHPDPHNQPLPYLNTFIQVRNMLKANSVR